MSGFPASLPPSRTPDPLAAPSLRWGILGTGWIADRFVASLQTHTRQQVAAVGSRDLATAHRFAEAHGRMRAHGSYADLVADRSVDIVYVATPHHLHVEHGVLAIEAGKHVLIEKPIALDSVSLDRLFTAADARGVMCQEAFWSFFLPRTDIIRQVLDDGYLGEVKTLLADHGEWLPPGHRIHDSGLAGGSLHDLGVYVLAIATWVNGPPTEVLATGGMTAQGVIGDVAIALRHPNGAVSSLSTTMTTTTPCRATIAGTNATLTTDEGFFFPGGFTVRDNRVGTVLRFDQPNTRHGALCWEAAEVARRVTAGELTTPCWTRNHSRLVTATLDAVNSRLGIG